MGLLLANDKAGAVRRKPKIGPSDQELKYESELYRWFCVFDYVFRNDFVTFRFYLFLNTKDTAGCL